MGLLIRSAPLFEIAGPFFKRPISAYRALYFPSLRESIRNMVVFLFALMFPMASAV